MTDRDTFAAAALTGWLASQQTVISQTEMAMRAYDYADAMLRVRAMRSSMECNCPTRDGYRIQTHGCPLHGSPAKTGAATLTDEEREALIASQGFWALEDSPHADTLRNLLERLK
jgi:hypothetical protein